MKLCHVLILLFVLFPARNISSKNNEPGLLSVNYKRSQYGALSQNWAVAFDDVGRAYFGNSGGVLEFNGKNWILHPHKSKTAIRSLYFEPQSRRLFSGCFEDFGYWQRDSLGVLTYVSLADSLNNYVFSGERIWSIVQYRDEILFQSFRSLFTYNVKTNKVRYVDPKGELLFLNKVDGLVYARISGKGIAVYQPSGFQLVNESEFAKNGTVRFFLPHQEGIILGDGKTGLHLLKGEKIVKWDCEANRYLGALDVNSAVCINDSSYAIGTLQGGLFIISREGEVLSHLDKQSKLENNTVLGIGLDHDHNLWLAMDNGISYIDLHSSVTYVIDLENAPSAIYSVIKYQGYVYVGTNNGVLYSKFNQPLSNLDFKDLKPLHGISGHIWKLDVLNQELLCGNNDGIYIIQKERAIPLSTTGGGTDFLTFRHHGVDWLIESTYYRIRLHKRVNNKWVFSHLVDGFSGSCRFIEMDPAGFIWLSHEIKGLTRLKLSDDLRTVVTKKEFGISTGLPTDYGLNVFKVNNRVVVTTGEDIYTFDDLNNQMVLYRKMNLALGRFKNAVRIVNVDEGSFWVITSNEAAYVSLKNDTIQVKKTLTLNEPYSFPDKYQNISITDSSSVLCLENGVAIVPNEETTSSTHLPLIITEVMNRQPGMNQNSVLFPIEPVDPVKIKNKFNNIQFKLSAVSFGPNNINYQYRIKNLYNEWTDSSPEDIYSVADVPIGNYIFEARAIYSTGNPSNTVSYPFEIRPKWYASRAGIVTILIIVFVLAMLLFLFNKRLVKMQTSEIEQKHESKHKQNESTIEQLRNDVLQKELENLQSKLTVSANALVEKDRSINTIKTELQRIYKKLEGRFPQREYNRIVKVIDEQRTQKRDMLNFEQHLAASQSGFYDKLKSEYPNLSPTDLRLCALLKMNLNSKEISVILGITVRSVEVSRYRLRKKMGLLPEENLNNVIMQI